MAEIVGGVAVVSRLRPAAAKSWLPEFRWPHARSAADEASLRAECGGPLQSVKPWRQADELRKP